MLEHDKSQENARHSIAEDHEIDELIEKLDETDMSSSAWQAYFKNLRELVFSPFRRGRAGDFYGCWLGAYGRR
ncbi:MAG: hypothetical protein M0Q90_11645 [Bacteroidales bacterium]|nr:hypothetical protein [Bacteroidales bacterium]